MDGNGRWARARGLPRIAGHRAGARAVRETVRTCAEFKIKALTLYAFSADNWKRPPAEISALMHLLIRFLRQELKELRRQDIRLKAIGRLGALPAAAQALLRKSIRETARNRGLTLTLALNYSARQEILDAARRLRREAVTRRVMRREDFRAYLSTSNLPDPDLIIRTSGEMRLSDFLLWQAAYSELWFTPVLWPDFNRKHLLAAFRVYQKRQRRFGTIGEC
jgi:undecaprenyl diphosphate synthase